MQDWFHYMPYRFTSTRAAIDPPAYSPGCFVTDLLEVQLVAIHISILQLGGLVVRLNKPSAAACRQRKLLLAHVNTASSQKEPFSILGSAGLKKQAVCLTGNAGCGKAMVREGSLSGMLTLTAVTSSPGVSTPSRA